MLVAEAVNVFAVVLGLEGEVAVGGGLFECLVLAGWVLDLGGWKEGVLVVFREVTCGLCGGEFENMADTYPEINVQVAGTAKLAIANLEGYRHLIIAVEVFVEALAAMSWELDVVCCCGA